MWTKFMDMHSGGGCKFKPFEYIYVEGLDEKDCRRIFEEKTGRDPDYVTCDCCGSDYTVSTADTLEEVTGYERHCDWDGSRYVERPHPRYGPVIPLDEYIARVSVKVYPLERDMTYEDSINATLKELGVGKGGV